MAGGRAAAVAVAALAVLACAVGGAAGADPAQWVRGVPASGQAAYLQGREDGTMLFTCGDGSKVSIEAVNDDFCDCADGSDEPGTSACPRGQFYCVQKGFHGKRVPSSQVNDGVCDCCDGTDEWDGSVACTNRCYEEGAQYRAAREEAMRVAQEGAHAKEEYIAAGREAKVKRKQSKEQKEAELEVAKQEKDAAETALKKQEEIEEAERSTLDNNKVEALYRGLGIDGMDADSLRALLVAHVRATNTSIELVERLNNAGSPDPQDDAHVSAPADAVEGATGDGSAEPAPKYHWTDEDVEFERPEAVAAREFLDEVSDRVHSLEREVKELQDSDNSDYGPDDEWYKLDKQCYQLKIQQYTYEVCPYGSAKQDHTSLGSWEGWENGHSTMKFTHGQHCWNGPSRSIKVHVQCGRTDELLSVDEPSTCAYEAKFASPAACDSKAGQEANFEELELNSDGVPVA